MRALVLFVTLLCIAGCHADYPDGTFGCAMDRDCPPGLHCVISSGMAGLCYAGDTGPTIDVGPLPDGGGVDALDTGSPRDVGPVPDTGCTTDTCVRIRVTNAWQRHTGALPPFSVDTVRFDALTFGETSPDTLVPFSGSRQIAFDLAAIGTVMLPAAGASFTILLSDDAGSAAAPTITVLPNGFGAAGATSVRFVSLAAGTPGIGIVEQESFSAVPGGTDVDAIDGVAAPVLVHPPGSSQLIAAYPSTSLPRMRGESYYAVFVGSLNIHQSNPAGLRMIPAIAGGSAVATGPILSFVNLMDGMQAVALCEVAAGGEISLHAGTAPSNDVFSIPGFGADGHARTVAAHFGTDCSGSNLHMADVGAAGAGPRFLLAAIGGGGGPDWSAALLSEPSDPSVMATPPVTQIVVFNQSGVTADFGEHTLVPPAFSAFPGTSALAPGASAIGVLDHEPLNFAIHGSPADSIAAWDDRPSMTPATFALYDVDTGVAPPVKRVFQTTMPYGDVVTVVEEHATAN